ncbi:uncharacterized protein LOC120011241 [Tripterygium wilfordii]|uniref:uncharacterized protein LOC120011241 n=1 Tax=Tripterygium wilfordii TaxID=458696 RepID=UPI0018F83A6F|nr:uncharacterized protein LOC120011241 [Tripterygium wilfordii]
MEYWQYWPMEITLVSANDLKDVRRFSEMDVYTVVSILGYPGKEQEQKQKTPVHHECGSHPKWNYTMYFVFSEAAATQNQLTLKIKIKTERTVRSSKEVVTVHVPIKKLFDEKAEENATKFVTHNIMNPNGKSEGTLNFSYKFGHRFTGVASLPGEKKTTMEYWQYWPMEITLVSANDLKDVRRFSEMDVYAVVSILGYPGKEQKQKTPVHHECGSHPKWNYTMYFVFSEAAATQNQLTLKIKIKTERTVHSSKEVVTVHVPIKKLFDEKAEENAAKFITHNIMNPNGKSEGTLNFSYMFGHRFTAVASLLDGPSSGGSTGSNLVVEAVSALLDVVMQ